MHVYLAESECIELDYGIYFVLNGTSYGVTTEMPTDDSWNIPKDFDFTEIEQIVKNGDASGALAFYNRSGIGSKVCCNAVGVFDKFKQIIHDRGVEKSAGN